MEQTILSGLMGSHSVGTATEDSDYDEMAVVIASPSVYLGVDDWGSQGTSESKITFNGTLYEKVSYEFLKFIKLCMGFNPNVIPLLYIKTYDDLSNEGELLLKQRGIFNSKRAVSAFQGYAYSQLKKMKDSDCPTGKMGEKRKALREKFGFDTKYAYHTIRLSRMILEFLDNEGQGMNVYRVGIDSENLVDIRNGKYTYEEVIVEVEYLNDKIKNHKFIKELPDEVDRKKINALCYEILKKNL
jgi:predicted nucleotidyltransferase